MNVYLIYFIVAFVVSAVVTGLVAVLMRRLKIIDRAPKEHSRKIHKRSIALGGGLAVYLTFFILVLVVWLSQSEGSALFGTRTLLGLFIGSTILMIGGVIDDKYTLRPRYQIISPILACSVVILFGIGTHVV
jgi:UDP-GlcNAc:undecaprenyl-phosphate GlcNAc-1-phosphate transferase